MITNDSTIDREVYGIDDNTMQRIKDFLQGAVYCWCKNRPNEWFAASDLVGGKNADWSNLPLNGLYQKYIDLGKPVNYAFDQSGIDLGHILKCVLKEDGRTFETRKGFTREYRWLGN